MNNLTPDVPLLPWSSPPLRSTVLTLETPALSSVRVKLPSRCPKITSPMILRNVSASTMPTASSKMAVSTEPSLFPVPLEISSTRVTPVWSLKTKLSLPSPMSKSSQSIAPASSSYWPVTVSGIAWLLKKPSPGATTKSTEAVPKSLPPKNSKLVSVASLITAARLILPHLKASGVTTSLLVSLNSSEQPLLHNSTTFFYIQIFA